MKRTGTPLSWWWRASLIPLMNNQLSNLNSHGISACYVGDSSEQQLQNISVINNTFCISTQAIGKPGGRGYFQKNWVRGVRPAFQNPYSIYDQNLRFFLPYLWPDQKFDTLFMTLVHSCRKHTFVKGFCCCLYLARVRVKRRRRRQSADGRRGIED